MCRRWRPGVHARPTTALLLRADRFHRFISERPRFAKGSAPRLPIRGRQGVDHGNAWRRHVVRFRGRHREVGEVMDGELNELRRATNAHRDLERRERALELEAEIDWYRNELLRLERELAALRSGVLGASEVLEMYVGDRTDAALMRSSAVRNGVPIYDWVPRDARPTKSYVPPTTESPERHN